VRYKLRTFTQSFDDEFKDFEVDGGANSDDYKRAEGLVKIIFPKEQE